MELTLDNQPLEVTEAGGALLRDVVERVSEQLKDQNRVVSEIFVDGNQIGGLDAPEVSEQTVEQCDSLRLISEEPRRLAHKVLYDIAEFMPNVQSALVETSSKIQSRNEQEGLLLLEQATATWAELLYGIQSALSVTGVTFESITVKGRPFLEINEEIHQHLEEASNFVENQQYLELSDILEYEIAPRLPLMQEGIYQLIKEMEKKPH